jgi:hypothetical protein
MNPVLLLAFSAIGTLLLASMLSTNTFTNELSQLYLQSVNISTERAQEGVKAVKNSNDNITVTSTIPTAIVKAFVVDKNGNIKATKDFANATESTITTIQANSISNNITPNDTIMLMTSRGNIVVVSDQGNDNDNGNGNGNGNIPNCNNPNIQKLDVGGTSNVQTRRNPCRIIITQTSDNNSPFGTADWLTASYYQYGNLQRTYMYRFPEGYSYTVAKIGNNLPSGIYSIDIEKDNKAVVYVIYTNTNLLDSNKILYFKRSNGTFMILNKNPALLEDAYGYGVGWRLGCYQGGYYYCYTSPNGYLYLPINITGYPIFYGQNIPTNGLLKNRFGLYNNANEWMEGVELIEPPHQYGCYWCNNIRWEYISLPSSLTSAQSFRFNNYYYQGGGYDRRDALYHYVGTDKMTLRPVGDFGTTFATTTVNVDGTKDLYIILVNYYANCTRSLDLYNCNGIYADLAWIDDPNYSNTQTQRTLTAFITITK